MNQIGIYPQDGASDIQDNKVMGRPVGSKTLNYKQLQNYQNNLFKISKEIDGRNNDRDNIQGTANQMQGKQSDEQFKDHGLSQISDIHKNLDQSDFLNSEECKDFG